MLRLDHITQRYGDTLVFQGITRTFAPGCYALCEEDSTGKSTLLTIIAGVLAPTEGDVWIDGCSLKQSPRQARARVAYVPDDCLAFPTLTGNDLLHKAAAERGIAVDDHALALADRLGATPHLSKRFEQMSTGTRRKFFLAAAALNDPSVIVADGPGNGLDVPAQAALADQFKVWGRDRVVLFASHDVALVDACNAQSIEIGSGLRVA